MFFLHGTKNCNTEQAKEIRNCIYYRLESLTSHRVGSELCEGSVSQKLSLATSATKTPSGESERKVQFDSNITVWESDKRNFKKR